MPHIASSTLLTFIFCLLTLTGCATNNAKTIRVATHFQLTPIETSSCVWVVRNNSINAYDGGSLFYRGGQNYLYLCCPSSSNEGPQCLIPHWSPPNNNLQVGVPSSSQELPLPLHSPPQELKPITPLPQNKAAPTF